MKNKHTLEDISNVAGKRLTDLLLGLMEEKYLLNWFYEPRETFDNKSPYDLCISGDRQQLTDRIINYMYGGIGT